MLPPHCAPRTRLRLPHRLIQDPNTAMRLAIFAHDLSVAGARKRIVALANGMAAAGIEVTLVLAHDSGPLGAHLSAAVGRLELQSVLPRSLAERLGRRAAMRAVIPALARYLQRQQPDILFSAGNHANLPAAWAHMLAGKGCRSRLVLRASNHLTRPRPGQKQRSPARTKPAVALSYPRAAAVVAVAEEVAQDVRAIAPRCAVTVLANPVLPDDLAAQAAAAAPHPWLADEKGPVILSVGRLVPQKDHKTLIAAFADLPGDTRLIIFGDGPERAALLAQIHRFGLKDRVALPGFVDNPYAAMARASLCVLSSAYEGLPGVLIEAMALGRPVVATDAPGGARSLLEGGRLGALVPPGEPLALAKAMLAALGTPATKRAALQARVAGYTVASAVAAHTAFFQDLLQEPPT